MIEERIQEVSPGCDWAQFAVVDYDELSLLLGWAHSRRRQWSAVTTNPGWLVTVEVISGSDEVEVIQRHYLSSPDSQDDDCDD